MNTIEIKAKEILKQWHEIVDIIDDKYTQSNNRPNINNEFISLIGNDLFTDKELIKEICKQESEFLLMNGIKIATFCSDDLKNDRDIALGIVKTHGDNLELLNNKFKDDKKFVLEALEYSHIIMHVSERLKDDDDVVNLAINKNSKSIIFVSERFRKNETFVMNLLAKDSYLIEHMHIDFRNDDQFLLKFWEKVTTLYKTPAIQNYNASKLIQNVGDKLQPFFRMVNSDRYNPNLIPEMMEVFDKIKLHKELNQELNIKNLNNNKKIKI